FLTSTEESFVRRLFQNSHIPGSVVGTGIDGPPEGPRPDRFRERFQVSGELLLYLGRVEAGKGCAEMLDLFCRYKARFPDGPNLVLLGKVDMAIPTRRDIRALGFVEEQDKWDALAGATLLVAPSPYESLSIALLEAWSQATPVLANGRCAVLAEQCLSGNGGLFYTNYAEFEACLDLLMQRTDLRSALGRQGRRHVEANYAWPQVLPKWLEALSAVAARPPPFD
ncbi:MAG: glycosyltransferase family 4 protein, partial [Dehalococcoidia bacterium]|nr:glycosyltransferase family 4 protein [Dehalococcoidia bacterium]